MTERQAATKSNGDQEDPETNPPQNLSASDAHDAGAR
jgi:hypothetical protein